MSVTDLHPSVVMPMYDPEGLLFPHLEAVTPQLKQLFSHAYVSIPPSTAARFPIAVARLLSDDFFHVLRLAPRMAVGEEFRALYAFAVDACPDEQVLHLCFVDRVAYALQSEPSGDFAQDIASLTSADLPLIFQRSQAAWDTHPRNYRQLEQAVTTAGELLLGRSLDFAWCHLALTGRQLADALPQTTRNDISMVAELIIAMKDAVRARDVDWLAWEDPFIYARDADSFREYREQSPMETNKRLAYVIPMLELLAISQNQ